MILITFRFFFIVRNHFLHIHDGFFWRFRDDLNNLLEQLLDYKLATNLSSLAKMLSKFFCKQQKKCIYTSTLVQLNFLLSHAKTLQQLLAGSKQLGNVLNQSTFYIDCPWQTSGLSSRYWRLVG